MLVCPLCRIALGAHDAVCPRDGNLGHEASWNVVPAALEKRFTLIAPFAHGPTGSTYLSDEPETGRRGLLKVLAPAPRTQAAERQRMRRELLKQATMAASSLALPFATGETEGTLWLFREHIEGIALHAHLSKHGPMPTTQALAIAAQLTSALDELHRAGLLHRDVKPGHVILAPDETGALRGVLIDAGVCKPLEGARTSGVIFGTAGYVAPEQLAGKLVSFRSDLYSLGCVIYEMLTAQAPFARADTESTLAAQQEGALPAFPAGLSPQVAAVVTSLLAKDPQDRPFSAQKLRRALDPFLPYGATVNRHPNASLNKPPADKPVMSPVAPSRIPGVPSGPPQRPTGRSSMPPPPPGRRSSPDATQQLQVEQIMEIAASPKPSGPRPASMAPPPMPQRSAESEAARKRDATEPVELDSVLEVKQSKPKKSDDTLSNDKTIERPKPERPSADMTQPIRLDQVLAVAAQHKKALSAPPPAPASYMPPAPIVAAPVAQVRAAKVAAAPVAPREETLIDDEPPSIELPIPDDVPDNNPLSAVLDQPAEPPRLPVKAAPAQAAAVPSHAESQGAAPKHISLIPDDVAEDDHDDDGSSDAAATVVARPSADRRSAYPTLTGMPNFVMPPAAGTVARGSEAPAPHHAAETPQQVAVGYTGTDSAQLTLPRDPTAAIEEAQRMDAQHRAAPPARQAARSPAPRREKPAAEDDSIFVLVSPQKRKIGYAAAAVVLLGVVGFGAAQLFGDDEKAIAKQDQGEATVSKTTATSALPPPAPAPAAAPIAAAPTGEPTPTVTRIEVVEPEPPPPPVAAEPEKTEAKNSEEEKSARSERSSRRERSSSRRESAESDKGDKGDNQELWSKARDEARAHYAAKRYKQAADAYAEAAKYNSSHAGTYAGLGGARLQAGDARGAIQAYQRAVKLSPDTSGFHAALGKAYLTAGDKSKAKASYKRALALDPKNEAAKAALSTL